MYEHNESHAQELAQVAEMLGEDAKLLVRQAVEAMKAGNAKLLEAIEKMKEN